MIGVMRCFVAAIGSLVLSACTDVSRQRGDPLVEFTVPTNVFSVDTTSATMVEFGAALCPACRDYALRTSPAITEALERDGRLRTLYVEYSTDPIEGQIFDSISCTDLPAITAFRKFYSNRPTDNIRSRDAYIAHAGRLFDRDTADLRMCMDSAVVRHRQMPLREAGARLKVSGTPTFVLGVLLADGTFRGWPTVGLPNDEWIQSTLLKAEAAMRGTQRRRK
jgi:hypothetical protein